MEGIKSVHLRYAKSDHDALIALKELSGARGWESFVVMAAQCLEREMEKKSSS